MKYHIYTLQQYDVSSVFDFSEIDINIGLVNVFFGEQELSRVEIKNLNTRILL